MQTVMIVKSVKLRARYVAGSGACVAFALVYLSSKSKPLGYSEEQYADIRDAWSSESVLEVASQISGDGDSCVKVRISVAVCDADVDFEWDVYGDDAFCDFLQIVELDKMHLRKQIMEVSKGMRVQTKHHHHHL
jgi:hypothetical protein